MATQGTGTRDSKDSLAEVEVLEWWRHAVYEIILSLEDSGRINSMKILWRSSSRGDSPVGDDGRQRLLVGVG